MPATRSGIEIANLDPVGPPPGRPLPLRQRHLAVDGQIPADRALQATFNMFADEAEAGLRELIEEAASRDARRRHAGP